MILANELWWNAVALTIFVGTVDGAGGATICHFTFGLLVTHGLLVSKVLLIGVNL